MHTYTVRFQIEDVLLLNFSNFGARFYSKMSKFYVVKFLLKSFLARFYLELYSICNTQSLTYFSRAHRRDVFSKIGMGNVSDITKKKCPQLTCIRTHACNSVYEGSHCSALFIGCVKYFFVCKMVYLCHYF